jgi:hypothetical protein
METLLERVLPTERCHVMDWALMDLLPALTVSMSIAIVHLQLLAKLLVELYIVGISKTREKGVFFCFEISMGLYIGK